MVIVIKIKNLQDLEKASKTLSGIHKKLPEMTSKAMMKWGKTLERDVKQSAMMAGIIPFTGILFNEGIRWEQRPKGKTGQLFIRQYGVALDEMKNHWVNITANRTRLLAWSRQANNPLIRNSATLISSGKMKKKKIFVRKHPYIRQGYNMARPKLKTILHSELNKLKQQVSS